MTWHVACAADAAYVGHCGAMLHSLFARNPRREVAVHFLHGPDFPAADRAKLRALVERPGRELHCHEIDDGAVAGLPRMGRIPQVMWYRVFLPDLLPGVERVLYLDADTLVLGALDELLATPLDGAYVAAVPNVLEPRYAAHPRELGLPATRRYFNSGVLLLHLDAMRADDCTRRIVEYATSEDLLWPDQDALNVVLGPRQVELHPRWNVMNSLYLFPYARDALGADAVAEACARPAIVHFEGPDVAKPWHYLNKHPWRDAYARHRASTPWPVAEIAGRTWRNRLLRPLPTRTTLAVLGRWDWLRGTLRHRLRRGSPTR
jgi:lipopolysaccharide biosynthesis glycosyltransferase